MGSGSDSAGARTLTSLHQDLFNKRLWHFIVPMTTHWFPQSKQRRSGTSFTVTVFPVHVPIFTHSWLFEQIRMSKGLLEMPQSELLLPYKTKLSTIIQD